MTDAHGFPSLLRVQFNFGGLPWPRRMRLALAVLRGAQPWVTLPCSLGQIRARAQGRVDHIAVDFKISGPDEDVN